jgi:adenine specific DNA methylase Mod
MTELSWQGKYNKEGKKNAPLRIELPFQTIETVNESAQERKQIADLFAQGKPTQWRNRLIWGDKKYVLPALLPEFAGKINLIYIDPPFDTGADFSFTAKIPPHDPTEKGNPTSFTKQPSIIEQKAYRDTWGKGLDSYLQWFYETALLLRELLAEDGSIYVHLDWHVGHYAKAVLDEVFGYENFRNEIFVKRVKKNIREREFVKSLNVAVDIVLFYAKSDTTKIFPPTKAEEKKARWHSFDAPEVRTGMDYEIFYNKPPIGRHWMRKKEIAEQWIKEGKLRKNPRTGKPEYLIDATNETLCDSLWNDIQAYTFKYDYPTEKNEMMLERIIKASSNEGDLILDCFCGSGTTPAVAEKLNRRWIACDLGRFAIHTTRKRLLSNPDVKPFIVQNLGKYERQHWMKSELTDFQDRLAQEKSYRQLILNLYHAANWLAISLISKAKSQPKISKLLLPPFFQSSCTLFFTSPKATGASTEPICIIRLFFTPCSQV